MFRLKIIGLIVVMGLLTGCAYFETKPSEVSFTPRFEGKYLTDVPLSDKWTDTKVLNYNYGHFTFPPPAGYRVLNYVDYVNNVSLDIHRELIDDKTDLLDIIKYRQGSDHCSLYGEKFTTISDVDLIEVSGNCYVWHRGDFKRKYYFIRVGPLVFTFRLLSSPNNFDKNLAEFDNFVDYAVTNYLLSPFEEQVAASYEHYAYPIKKEELISFFQPGVEELPGAEE